MRKIITEAKKTIYYFDTLITTNILKATGFIQSQSKASAVIFHEANSSISLCFTVKDELLGDEAGLKSDLENLEACFNRKTYPYFNGA